MAKVYITEANALDYTPAEAYGEIVVLRSPKFAAGIDDDDWNGEIKQSLRKQLADYVPMQDFIIPTGDPLKISFVPMLLMEKGKRHRYLKWDAMAYRYIAHVLDAA